MSQLRLNYAKQHTGGGFDIIYNLAAQTASALSKKSEGIYMGFCKLGLTIVSLLNCCERPTVSAE